jgi:cellulose synthase/poly-beta-1,6-N-acetylglucosamine synthase-like glycosyltransferase
MSLVFVCYTYFGYPLLLRFRARRVAARSDHSDAPLPPVVVIIPAYNEEAAIAAKIRNVLFCTYPPERLRLIVIIDGASDATAKRALAITDPRLTILCKTTREGKMAAINDGMKQVTAPVTVLTDAAELLEADTIARLVAHFVDPEVGAVSGELALIEQNTGFSRNLGLYWTYEKMIRADEAAIGSVVGATGPIYALRTELFRPLPPDTVLDDVAIPFEVVRRGYRVVYDRKAHAIERTTSDGTQEFARKRRTLAGNYQIIHRYWRLLIPFRSPIAWQFWSHKVFRLFIPYALVGIFVGGFGLPAPWRDIVSSAEILFYLLALWVYLDPKATQRRWLQMPYTFCLLNWATLSGSFYYYSGRMKVQWEKVK